MAFVKAVRRAVPIMVELSGVSGGGKTTTALLIAAGMAGGNGRVGLIDTENGRGSLLADEQIILDALPSGYEYDELVAPFTPERYTDKIIEAEKSGINVLVIDSTSHEFEGLGGISDIAEQSKMGWAPAKMRHKRFMIHCLSSQMDIIFCFRARPKVKIVGKDVIDLGILPACEKNWGFDMTFRWHLEDKSHNAVLLKAPRCLEDKKMTGRMLNSRDGMLMREWKLKGSALDPFEQLRKRSTAAAEQGMVAYTAFFESLSKAEKKAIVDTVHSANKAIAVEADASSAEDGELKSYATWAEFELSGEAFGTTPVVIGGVRYEFDSAAGNYRKSEPDAVNAA